MIVIQATCLSEERRELNHYLCKNMVLTQWTKLQETKLSDAYLLEFCSVAISRVLLHKLRNVPAAAFNLVGKRGHLRVYSTDCVSIKVAPQ